MGAVIVLGPVVIFIIITIVSIVNSVKDSKFNENSRDNIKNRIELIKGKGITKDIVRRFLESEPMYVNYEINLNVKQLEYLRKGYTFELYHLYPHMDTRRWQVFIVLVMYTPEGFVCTVDTDFSDHPSY